MNNSRTIDTARSADLVSFNILIEGAELSAVYQIKNISVEKEINRIPFAQLVFFDGDAASQNFGLSNEDLLIPGKEIEIKAGYHHDNETIFKGIIIKHSIKIRENSSVLIVECRDEAVKMTIGRKSNYYYESKDSDIIEEIIGKHNLQSDVEATTFTNKEIVQYRTSDWDFIITRAQLNGQVCRVDDGEIFIAKPDLSADAIETVAFGATLLDFDAEMDARNQFSSITAFGWNPSDQEIVSTEAIDPTFALNGNISVSDLASVINLEDLELKHGGNYNSTQLQQWSDAKNVFQQLSKTRGRVKFQGISGAKPGTMLKLEGVGDRFNGKIFISAVRHEIADGNWTVDAEFGVNPNWFSETYDITELPASGIIPAVSGLQIGVVSQLESDPDGEDRVLVKIPIINKDQQGIWARIATLDAGDKRGSFFLPEIGDEVIVGFINDDPNHAVILGMLHSSAKPAPITASDNNHEKGFVTRSEIKLIFNDKNKSIILETPGGKKIQIDEDAGVIKIEDDNRNTIIMDDGGIAIESGSDLNIKATGDCNIDATNINLKANAQFKAEGSAGAEISTNAVAVLKGSLVQIN
ncbi:type VI secretion system tip protein VgrG [Aequorivita marisscotiae]|uniref:Type VI secretion system tip protein VgrG n=1 Tax=Aequorivita marisscotiae TaxID=3040348 RepID=A0ABY8KQS5_9FLAO|nr:type VI secretion system tip protein VgrG [Aequorivita sp. Ant34-E75]WGF91818.1 type VI secretion system tip protein VgrG [Aequorivita sp. Ant34-E75]